VPLLSRRFVNHLSQAFDILDEERAALTLGDADST
jgi:hypothetical protein